MHETCMSVWHAYATVSAVASEFGVMGVVTFVPSSASIEVAITEEQTSALLMQYLS